MNLAEEARRRLAAAPADLRFAVLFAPHAQRSVLTTLFAVYLEIREILRECSDADVARAKLGWWREEIALLAGHRARHPLSIRLDQLIGDVALPTEPLYEIIESVARDIDAAAFHDFDEVEKYCRQRGGALTELTTALAGACIPGTLAAARLLGRSWQLADIVVNGLVYAEHGRIYFASDDLRKHGIDRHVSGAAHSFAGVQALLADYAARARALHATALAQTEVTWSDLSAGLVLGGLAQARLKKFARTGYPKAAAPVELQPFAQLWTAWRSARRAR
ncbi:MAG: squalene/phytoene synthase family protein [Gammaproteobacteria bacterium]|nr:squalene/phytoene synthase family protein [Gammaproteobacteria bacterium]